MSDRNDQLRFGDDVPNAPELPVTIDLTVGETVAASTGKGL
jgi:hypothetical protein